VTRKLPCRILPSHAASGFSLVELMVAVVLSLLVSISAISLFISNKRMNAATDGIDRIQENARTSFELMSRDIREAGGIPCDVRQNVVNVLSDTTNWWATYDVGIAGYDNGAYPGSVAGTDAIQVQYFEDTGIVTSAAMAGTTGALTVSAASKLNDIKAQQILMACGFFSTATASIFSAGKSGATITHATGVGTGNASADFSDAGHPTPVVYPVNTLLGSLRAMQWYVAAGSHGGNSLYRRQLRNPGATVPEMGAAEEVVTGVAVAVADDVHGLRLSYLVDGTWETSPPGGDWSRVTAVQIELWLEARDNRAGGVEGKLITRKLMHVVALRNKL
jgi:type IV pilus assembly protein PilW